MWPYFIRHYEQYCERIVVYDNGSDDGTQDLVRRHSLCELRHVDSRGQFDERILMMIKGQMWKESRKTADWVICCDVDELLYHPRLMDYLADCRQRSVTIPVPSGWQMVHDRFPSTDRQVYDEIRTAVSDARYGKRIIFNPAAIHEINYWPGCHIARPEGDISEDSNQLLKLLHFKFLGLEYVAARYMDFARRMSDFNRANGFGAQYLQTPEQLEAEFRRWQSQARPLEISE